MSRWMDNYKNHPFWSDWNELQDMLSEADIDDETVLTSVEELARLKKAVKYLDGLMGYLDPELVPATTWDSFQQQVTPCNRQVANYNSNRNIAHLNNANDHVDNLLSYVRPWVIAESHQALDAMKNSLDLYNATINKYSEKNRNEARSLISDIENKKNDISEIYDAVTGIKSGIEKFESQLFESDEDKKSLKERINALVEKLDSDAEKINDYFDELLEGDEDNNSIKKQVADAASLISSKKDDAEVIVEKLSSRKQKLEKLYIEIFGDPDAENTKVRSGLKGEILTRIQALDEFDIQQKQKYQTLFELVESLLPGATSAGLATAYQEMKLSFDQPITNATRMFYASLALIVLVSFYTAIVKFSWTEIQFVTYAQPLDFINSLIYKLPVFIPTLWLAIHASKRRSQMQRLQQEYAHKESLAKSYNSFKKQIQDLGEEDNALQKQLIEKAVAAIADNASKTLDGKHGDTMPSQSIMDKIVESVSKNMGLGR